MNPVPVRANAVNASPIIGPIMNFLDVFSHRLPKGLMTGLIKNSFPLLKDKIFKPLPLPLTFLSPFGPDRALAALPRCVLQSKLRLAEWKGEWRRA